jgi:hypothetical protein
MEIELEAGETLSVIDRGGIIDELPPLSEG